MSISEPLRVGIVGLSAAGGWASRAHVPALTGSRHFTVIGTCASTTDSAAAAAEKYDLPIATTSAAELAADDRVDAIVVAVRVPRHEAILREVLPVGKPTFSEWPLAPDARIAEELARLADRHRTPTAVGLQARHVPEVRLMKRLIEAGHIGQIRSARVIADGGGWGAMTQSATAYTVDAAAGATMAAIPLGHTLDAVVDILGPLEPLSVATAIDYPDVVVVDTGEVVRKTTPDQIALVARTANGAILTVHYQGGLSKGTNFLWEVGGTGGVLQLTGATGHLQFGAVTLRCSRDDGALEQLMPVAGKDYRVDDGGPDTEAGPAFVVAQQYAAWHEALTGTPTEHPATTGFDHAVAHHRLIDDILRMGRLDRDRDRSRP